MERAECGRSGERGDGRGFLAGSCGTAFQNARSSGAENIAPDFDGLRFDLVYEGARQAIESPLAGRINVLNILAAAAVGLSYGIDLETIARGIAQCRAVPGRFERIDMGQPFLVVVDYAHTDDALAQCDSGGARTGSAGPCDHAVRLRRRSRSQPSVR